MNCVAVSTPVQSPPRMFNPTSVSLATAPMVPPQGIVQATFMPQAPPPATMMNYPPPAPPPGAPQHYPMAGHVPLQTYGAPTVNIVVHIAVNAQKRIYILGYTPEFLCKFH